MRDKTPAEPIDTTVARLPVEIAELNPMRVAAAYAYGREPEQQTWNTLIAWVRAHGMEETFTAHRFFGFNNPDPRPGHPEHGYEQWMTVDDSVEGGGGVILKSFGGGRFLSTPCQGLEDLPEIWQRLFRWCQGSAFLAEFNRPFLEECLTPLARRPEAYRFRLLLPVSAIVQTGQTPQAA